VAAPAPAPPTDLASVSELSSTAQGGGAGGGGGSSPAPSPSLPTPATQAAIVARLRAQVQWLPPSLSCSAFGHLQACFPAHGMGLIGCRVLAVVVVAVPDPQYADRGFVAGDAYYVIDAKWYHRWQSAVGYSSTMEDLALAALLEQRRSGAAPSVPPVPAVGGASPPLVVVPAASIVAAVAVDVCVASRLFCACFARSACVDVGAWRVGADSSVQGAHKSAVLCCVGDHLECCFLVPSSAQIAFKVSLPGLRSLACWQGGGDGSEDAPVLPPIDNSALLRQGGCADVASILPAPPAPAPGQDVVRILHVCAHFQGPRTPLCLLCVRFLATTNNSNNMLCVVWCRLGAIEHTR
jgi:hypothetical protein